MTRFAPKFLFLILLTVLFLNLAMPSYAYDSARQDIGILSDKIERLEDDVSKWKTEAAKIKDRADRYDKMAKEARDEIEKSKHQADKDHWEDSAKKRTERANNLRSDAKKILAKVKTTEDEIKSLKKKLKNTEQTAQRDAAERSTQADKKSENAFTQNEEKDTENLFQLPLEKLIGMWEVNNQDVGFDPGILTIVPEQPNSEAYKHNLVVYTNDARRKWEGKYHAAEEIDAEAMVTLSYTPKPEEMNPDIPTWVRKQIEGELEWKIELHDDGTWGTPRFIAKFYPGEVEWDEKALESDEKSAWVIGKGKPREYTYTPVEHDIMAYGYGAPEVHLRMKGAPEGDKRVIEALTKRQEFFVEVFLPPDMAKQQGRSLTVDIQGLGNESSTTLELKAGKIFEDKRTTYSHRQPVTIANRGDRNIEERDAPRFSVNWLLGNKHPGTRLNLDIQNGEVVKFFYDGSYMRVPVYNSYVQRGIARHVNAMNITRAHYTHIVQDNKASTASRNDAQRRLNMIKNYNAILSSEAAHDKIKHAVGEKYFGSLKVTANSFGILETEFGEPLEGPGLVGKSLVHIQNVAETTNIPSPDGVGTIQVTGELSNEQRKGSSHKSGYFDGALWTHPYEKAVITRAAISARDKTRKEALDELPLAAAYALYAGIAAASNVDSAMTVYTFFYSGYESLAKNLSEKGKLDFDGVGRDIMGKKVQDWEVGMAGIGFTSGQILSFGMPHIMTGPSMTSPYKPNASARVKHMRDVAKTSERTAFTKGRARKNAKARLNEMTDEQVVALEATINHTAPDAVDSWNNPISCASTKKTTANLVDRVNSAENPTPLKSASPKKTSAPPPRPAEFKPADKPNIANDVTPKVMKEVKGFHGIVKAVGPEIFKPQDFGMCNCMFWMRGLMKKGATAISEIMAFAMARKLVPGERPIELVHGMTDKVSVALAEALGFKVIYDATKTKLLRWERYAHFVKEGYIVRGTIKPKNAGGDGNHSVAIIGFGRDAKGDIIDITFYDPAFGRDITMDIRHYEAIAEDGYGLFLLHDTKRPTVNKLMKDSYKAMKNKPTISFPEGHPQSSKVPANKNAPLKSSKTKALDETWVEEDFEVPSAQSAIESSNPNAGTSKAPTKKNFKDQAQRGRKDLPTPPDPKDDDRDDN